MGWPLGQRCSICHSGHLPACSVASTVHLPGVLSYITPPKPTLPSLPYFSKDKRAHSRVGKKKEKMTSVIFTELLGPTHTWEVNPLVSSGSSFSIVITHRGIWLKVWYIQKKNLMLQVFRWAPVPNQRFPKKLEATSFSKLGITGQMHWTNRVVSNNMLSGFYMNSVS